MSRSESGRLLSAVLPGLPQLLAGRWAAGGSALAVWTGLLVVAGMRGAKIPAALDGGWDERIAVLTLVAALAAAWCWSWRDLGLAGSGPATEMDRGLSQWRLAGRGFARNHAAVMALIVVGGLYLVALITPLIAPYDPAFQGDLLTERFLAPSPVHLLGTDQYARDVLSRLLYGARISLTIGFVAVAIAVTLGTLLGAVSGYLGGKVDSLIMRVVDTMIAFPRLVLLITVVAMFPRGVLLIILVLGLTLWPGTARIVRSEVLTLREREFVLAARALGYSTRRIVLRHLIPNALGPVIVATTLGIGDTIVLEAGLSFLGLGIQPPTPSWGTMVAAGRLDLLDAWWLATFPGLAIVFTVLAFNLVGDGLRDALDPRTGP